MTKKTIYLLLFLLCTYSSSEAQKAKSKWQFKSTNLIGNLIGEQGSKFSMQSINGFTKNNWSVGLGVGIDPYAHSSIPVFLDIRKSMAKKLGSPLFMQTEDPVFRSLIQIFPKPGHRACPDLI